MFALGDFIMRQGAATITTTDGRWELADAVLDFSPAEVPDLDPFADDGMVQNRRADADQATPADTATMQHHLVADGDIGFQNQRRARVGMKHATILHIGAWADHDGFVVPAQYGVPPDRGLFGALNQANQHGAGGNPGGRVDLGNPVFELIDAHGAGQSSKMGGWAFYADLSDT